MSSNYFGRAFRFTTWGESHGPAIGCVVDGCPPMLELLNEDFTKEMARRKPGQSKFTTQRKEEDKVEILSGTFEGKTTGTPISLVVYNKDQRSHDYSEIANKFRPNHADFTYQEKYGIRDYRGGGRSSARETAMRVAAGVIARKIIPSIQICARIVQLGEIEINGTFDKNFINKNPFFIGVPSMLQECEDYLTHIRKKGSSVGAIVEVIAKNVPTCFGEPLYYKLDAQIANAMLSINAVKGVEIGQGFAAGSAEGHTSADEMHYDETGKLHFTSNNNGGVIGGISSGQEVVARVAIKPTSSILQTKNTVDVHGSNTTISTKGRHDPCVGIRAVPVVEAMLACVLADMHLLNKCYK